MYLVVSHHSSKHMKVVLRISLVLRTSNTLYWLFWDESSLT